jgi:hypothetical protein
MIGRKYPEYAKSEMIGGSTAFEADNAARAFIQVLQIAKANTGFVFFGNVQRVVEKVLGEVFPIWKEAQAKGNEIFWDAFQSVLYKHLPGLKKVSDVLESIHDMAKDEIEKGTTEAEGGHPVSKESETYKDFLGPATAIKRLAEPFALKTQGYDAIDVAPGVPKPQPTKVPSMKPAARPADWSTLAWVAGGAVAFWYFFMRKP